MIAPKFVNTKPSFHSELKKRIAEYFDKTGLDSTGNYKLWIKAGVLVRVQRWLLLNAPY